MSGVPAASLVYQQQQPFVVGGAQQQIAYAPRKPFIRNPQEELWWVYVLLLVLNYFWVGDHGA